MSKVCAPDKAVNPRMSAEQKAFEEWARKPKQRGLGMDLRRNFYVPYHGAPYTYQELFGEIKPTDYYSDDKAQGAWDGWSARSAFINVLVPRNTPESA
jgi:hypothetical protein